MSRPLLPILLVLSACGGGHPSKDPSADGTDSGSVDTDSGGDDTACEPSDWYADGDGDGYGDESVVVSACDQPDGYVADRGDCNDEDPAVRPDADEACNEVDDDCDGDVDEGFATDSDADGVSLCDDCDDGDDRVYPGAVEVCDGMDDDCDGVIPAEEVDDGDHDGYSTCEDCDDGSLRRSPRVKEWCNGVDDNCDGVVDEACVVCDVVVPDDQPTVQQGVDEASSAQAVCVWNGTYAEQVSLDGRDVHLVGLVGSGWTVLDGGGGSPTLSVVASAAASVQGFTLRGAVGGPGVEVDSSTLALTDVRVTGNTNFLSDSGGGLHLADSIVTIADSLFSDNYNVTNQGSWGPEGGVGGGIYATDTELSLSNVVISENLAGSSGGGLYLQSSTATLSDLWISGNYIYDGAGAGVYAYDSALHLTNAVVYFNTASGCACPDDEDDTTYRYATNAGLLASGGTVDVTNSVFADNERQGRLEAGLEVSGATLNIVNTVLLADTAWVTADSIQNSNVWGRTTTTFGEDGTDGNISVDPLFLELPYSYAVDPDFHLDPSSPLIDAGSSTLLDPDGSPSDMGMYGGPAAGGLDRDRDGWPSWWRPGPYDAATSPDYDCDDGNPAAWPGHGC